MKRRIKNTKIVVFDCSKKSANFLEFIKTGQMKPYNDEKTKAS